tara:strand:- start:321 stop:497 length:177 start_codon:yes stop_codon:yes gene_type:complete
MNKKNFIETYGGAKLYKCSGGVSIIYKDNVILVEGKRQARIWSSVQEARAWISGQLKR